jgi:hypothetical protein
MTSPPLLGRIACKSGKVNTLDSTLAPTELPLFWNLPLHGFHFNPFDWQAVLLHTKKFPPLALIFFPPLGLFALNLFPPFRKKGRIFTLKIFPLLAF